MRTPFFPNANRTRHPFYVRQTGPRLLPDRLLQPTMHAAPSLISIVTVPPLAARCQYQSIRIFASAPSHLHPVAFHLAALLLHFELHMSPSFCQPATCLPFILWLACLLCHVCNSVSYKVLRWHAGTRQPAGAHNQASLLPSRDASAMALISACALPPELTPPVSALLPGLPLLAPAGAPSGALLFFSLGSLAAASLAAASLVPRPPAGPAVGDLGPAALPAPPPFLVVMTMGATRCALGTIDSTNARVCSCRWDQDGHGGRGG